MDTLSEKKLMYQLLVKGRESKRKRKKKKKVEGFEQWKDMIQFVFS